MSSGKVRAALALSLVLLTGCGPKRPKGVVSPVAQVPDLPPAHMALALPAVPPPFPPIASRSVKLDTTAPPEVKPEVATTEPRKTPKHRAARPSPDEAKTATAAPSPQPPIQMSPAQPSDQTPIGQLSADGVSPANRQDISNRIDSTENGLNSIKRSLNSDEQKTVTLIRQYITRARDALKVDDLDGANTLSTKAAQLLQELTKP